MTAQSFAFLHDSHTPARQQTDNLQDINKKKERHKNEKAYKKFAGRTKMLNFATITDMHEAYGDIQGNLNHTL